MENQMKFSGVVKHIAVTTGTSNGKDWEKHTVIIEEQKDQYPQSICIEAFNKSDEVAKIKVGTKCDAIFNVGAKEYNGRWFGSNNLWKFENIVSNETQQPQQQAQPVSEGTDLPF